MKLNGHGHIPNHYDTTEQACVVADWVWRQVRLTRTGTNLYASRHTLYILNKRLHPIYLYKKVVRNNKEGKIL